MFVLSGAFLWNSSLGVNQAAVDAENYKSAIFCSTQLNCRQTTTATVLSSLTFKAYANLPGYTGTNSRGYINSYRIRLKFTVSDIQDVRILPNLTIATKDFGVGNVYLPFPKDSYDHFAETSFPPGAILKIELWQGKPTIIYTRYINSSNPSESDIEYAVPTINNPLVYYPIERSDFYQTFAVLGGVLVLLVTIRLLVKKHSFMFWRQHAIIH